MTVLIDVTACANSKHRRGRGRVVPNRAVGSLTVSLFKMKAFSRTSGTVINLPNRVSLSRQ